MSRRRPLCAWCGERLTVRQPVRSDLTVQNEPGGEPGAPSTSLAVSRSSRSDLTVENHYYDLPGKPTVGWHADCADADPLGAAVLLRREEPRRMPVPWALAYIDQRGEGRVVRRRR